MAISSTPNHLRIAYIAGIVSSLALALTGCSGSPSGTTLPNATMNTPAAGAEEAGPSDMCDGDISARVDPLDGGTLKASYFAGMRDTGDREFATGTVTLASDGTLATYTVAEGDADLAIADRFCVARGDLYLLNAVKFCTGHTIQPGDVFNLSPYDVATAGGPSGEACDNELTFLLPRR